MNARARGAVGLGEKLGDRIAAGLAVAAFLFLVGVVYAGLTMPTRPKDTSYILEIDARAEGEVVKVQGKTTLPDGARLEVYVDRLYRVKGSDVWSAARVGSAQAIVSNQRWEAEIPVDDGHWVEEVGRRIRERALDPVEAIHSSLRASVVFSPHLPQAHGVQTSLGHNFERLSDSEQAVNVDGFWILSASDTVEMPMDRELEAKLLPAGV